MRRRSSAAIWKPPATTMVFIIIDGEFGQNLSVTPKEILSVLERGKTVIGASSMGALRASELDRCGMIGVRWVYDCFRRSAIRRDADVALVFSPIDPKPMTVPMVDLEFWMEQALRRGGSRNKESARLLKPARRSSCRPDTGPADGRTAPCRPHRTLDGTAGIFRRNNTEREGHRRDGSASPEHFAGRTPPAQGLTTLRAQTGFRHQARTEPAAHRIAQQGPAGSGIVRPAFRDPEAIGRELDLPPEEIQAIKLLDRQKFEQAIARLRWG